VRQKPRIQTECTSPQSITPPAPVMLLLSNRDAQLNVLSFQRAILTTTRSTFGSMHAEVTFVERAFDFVVRDPEAESGCDERVARRLGR
jgi:hypothetical protein